MLKHFENPYITEFETTIESCEPHGENFIVCLNETYFYPSGGGQDCDTGTINDVPIVEVFKDEFQKPFHIVSKKLEKGTAYCKIDKDRRTANMQQHTGQHLLSMCFYEKLNIDTNSVRIYHDKPSYIDICVKNISNTQINMIEDYANEIIQKNLIIKTYFVNETEIDNVPFRRNIAKVKGTLRVVEIDGMDFSACGGTHCSSTSEINLLKIIKIEKINNDTRIFYTTGKLSLSYFRKYEEIVNNIAQKLRTHAENINPLFLQILQNQVNIQKENQQLKKQILPIEAEQLYNEAKVIGENKVLILQESKRDIADLKNLASELQKKSKLIALLISSQNEKISIIVSCSVDSGFVASELFKKIADKFQLKGGGNKDLAQGGGEVNLPNLLDTVNDILKYI